MVNLKFVFLVIYTEFGNDENSVDFIVTTIELIHSRMMKLYLMDSSENGMRRLDSMRKLLLFIAGENSTLIFLWFMILRCVIHTIVYE